jgi:hypothetical protein
MSQATLEVFSVQSAEKSPPRWDTRAQIVGVRVETVDLALEASCKAIHSGRRLLATKIKRCIQRDDIDMGGVLERFRPWVSGSQR